MCIGCVIYKDCLISSSRVSVSYQATKISPPDIQGAFIAHLHVTVLRNLSLTLLCAAKTSTFDQQCSNLWIGTFAFRIFPDLESQYLLQYCTQRAKHFADYLTNYLNKRPLNIKSLFDTICSVMSSLQKVILVVRWQNVKLCNSRDS